MRMRPLLNDPFSYRDIQHNCPINAYRVAHLIYQAESAMTYKGDQMNEQIGKAE